MSVRHRAAELARESARRPGPAARGARRQNGRGPDGRNVLLVRKQGPSLPLCYSSMPGTRPLMMTAPTVGSVYALGCGSPAVKGRDRIEQEEREEKDGAG